MASGSSSLYHTTLSDGHLVNQPPQLPLPSTHALSADQISVLGPCATWEQLLVACPLPKASPASPNPEGRVAACEALEAMAAKYSRLASLAGRP